MIYIYVYISGAGVKSLNSNKFPGKDAKHSWLVEFYAPWCHLQPLARIECSHRVLA